MFDSISNIFSLPTVTKNRYKVQLSLQQFLRQKQTKSKRAQFKDPYLDSLIQCLKKPVEEWILHQEQHLRSYAVNKLIFRLIVQNASRGKLGLQQISRITVHNFFVLAVQYEVMSELINQMSMPQLELIMDGACAIIIKNPDDSTEELTCVLHHIISHSPLQKSQKINEDIVISRPLDLDNIPNFLILYGQLNKQIYKPFYDGVVRVIPLISELFKLISHTNKQLEGKHLILKEIPWAQEISYQLLQLICLNVDQIVKNQAVQQGLDSIPYQDDVNPSLKKKLIEQAKKIRKSSGFVASKELFVFACTELYYFQHVLRLAKSVLKLVNREQQLMVRQQGFALRLIKGYLNASFEYDVNIPSMYFGTIKAMLAMTKFQTKAGIEHLASVSKMQYIQKQIEGCLVYQWQNRQTIDVQSLPEFCLQNDKSLLQSLLSFIYSLQLQNIDIIQTIFDNTAPKLKSLLQCYLIKSAFLNFLIEEQASVQGQEPKSFARYFKMVAYLVKGNPCAHCVLDSILQKEFERSKRSLFVEEIRKHFFEAKSFLLSVLADTITQNTRHKGKAYFLPEALKMLFYPDSKPKHDIWISYIHDVIVRELRTANQKLEIAGRKDAQIEADINQWISLAIMIEIEHVMCRRGQDFELGEFTMNYMTTILNEAIKWKYEDQTSAMKRILFNYQQWENYYSQVILNNEYNEDVIETKIGPAVTFLFLKRWNKKICNAINIFIETVLTTVVSDELP